MSSSAGRWGSRLAERCHDVRGSHYLGEDGKAVEGQPLVVSGTAAALVSRTGDVGELTKTGSTQDNLRMVTVRSHALPLDGIERPLLVPSTGCNRHAPEIVHTGRAPQ